MPLSVSRRPERSVARTAEHYRAAIAAQSGAGEAPGTPAIRPAAPIAG
ncbi:hypothetical protein ACFXJ5_32165 [Streptomyces sp. NPDC059373]